MARVMRPVLKPALRQVWRDSRLLQIGTEPEHAIVLQLDAAATTFLRALDGTRSVDELMELAASLGLRVEDAATLLRTLAERRALDDAAQDTTPVRDLPTVERERLRPDLAALGLRSAVPGDGMRALGRRRRAAVTVHGTGRIGALIACQLAGSGIGCVVPIDAGQTRPADLVAGGLGADALGARRQDAVRALLRRAAPSVRTSLPPPRRRPDLAVVAPVGRWPRDLPPRLSEEGVCHLIVLMRDVSAQVGPLVVPGRTSCLRCHHMHRSDRDPAWPRILAQLSARPADTPAEPGGAADSYDYADLPCDAALATLAATHTALHALAFLDGDEPPSLDATLELTLPYGEVGVRAWTPHPACGCTDATRRAESAQPARRDQADVNRPRVRGVPNDTMTG